MYYAITDISLLFTANYLNFMTTAWFTFKLFELFYYKYNLQTLELYFLKSVNAAGWAIHERFTKVCSKPFHSSEYRVIRVNSQECKESRFPRLFFSRVNITNCTPASLYVVFYSYTIKKNYLYLSNCLD